MGHEFMGIVEEVGPEVKDIKKGDRVVSSFDMGCGRCYFCKKVCRLPVKTSDCMWGQAPILKLYISAKA